VPISPVPMEISIAPLGSRLQLAGGRRPVMAVPGPVLFLPTPIGVCRENP
jgi:hypothetical protein